MSGYEEIEGIDASTYAGKAIKACKKKARGIMGDELLIFQLMDIVKFMMLSNEFMAREIFITDDNREESYIKVIESGDAGLIDKLEEYLNTKDSIKGIQEKIDEYQAVVNSIVELSDYEDQDTINSIIKEYLQR